MTSVMFEQSSKMYKDDLLEKDSKTKKNKVLNFH